MISNSFDSLKLVGQDNGAQLIKDLTETFRGKDPMEAISVINSLMSKVPIPYHESGQVRKWIRAALKAGLTSDTYEKTMWLLNWTNREN